MNMRVSSWKIYDVLFNTSIFGSSPTWIPRRAQENLSIPLETFFMKKDNLLQQIIIDTNLSKLFNSPKAWTKRTTIV